MRRLLGDLKALGVRAPVRAAYEILYRLGIIGRILRRRSASSTVPTFRSPLPGPLLPAAARDSVIREAAEIVSGTISVFGRTVRIADDPAWHSADGGEVWPMVPSWRLDIRSETDRDVKHAWEIARHRHLVVLALAVKSTDVDAAYLETLERHLHSWIEQNPPEVGVHWRSSLELALRAVAWLQVIDLVGDVIDSRLRRRMADHLYHSGRHIVAELPYTLSSMRNNHLIGDAIGLVAIGSAFPGDRTAQRWMKLGDRLLRRHLPHHFARDGSSLEDSLGYRSFVLEMLAVRSLLGDAPPEVADAIERGGRHLQRLGVGYGPVPRFGDWDGGTALFTGRQLPPPESAADLARRLTGANAHPVADGSDAGGGLGRVARGPFTVWLKASSGESHGHADLLSTAICHNGDWLVGDPGNGSYNRSRSERDYFRMSIAHSVLRVNGVDQREPHRRFRWKHAPTGRLGPPFQAGRYAAMWGTHDAYLRLTPPQTVLRVCLVSTTSVVVADWLSTPGGEWRLSLPLHADVEYRAVSEDGPSPESVLRLSDGRSFGLLLPGPASRARGTFDPYDGWWADDYDALRPATRLEIAGAHTGPIAWAVWSGEKPHVSTAGGVLTVDEQAFRVVPATAGGLRLLNGPA